MIQLLAPFALAWVYVCFILLYTRPLRLVFGLPPPSFTAGPQELGVFYGASGKRAVQHSYITWESLSRFRS